MQDREALFHIGDMKDNGLREFGFELVDFIDQSNACCCVRGVQHSLLLGFVTLSSFLIFESRFVHTLLLSSARLLLSG